MSELNARTMQIEAALRALQHGQIMQAQNLLCGVLADNPMDAEAHALLSLVLLAGKRLAAAHHEAGQAVAHAPDMALGHMALGRVLLAQRKLNSAEEHLQQAVALDPDDERHHLALSALYSLRGDRARQMASVEHALSLAPDDPEVLAEVGRAALAQGDIQRAHDHALYALEIDPGNLDGLVLMGHVCLRRGNAEDARQHALWALQQQANDVGALGLLSAIKARTSPLLGLWWRFNTKLIELGEGRSMLVLIGAYVAYRIATRAANDLDAPTLASIVSLSWTAACIYTWVGPGIFERAVKKELAQVKLNPNY